VTAVKSRGCFHYSLTNQQVELLSKIAFLENKKEKISSRKLHQCIPILVNLYKIVRRYQKRINTDFKPAKHQEATVHLGTIDCKNYCPLEVKNGIKVIKIDNKYKFEQFDCHKAKEIMELESEISNESTEYETIYEKEIKEKAAKFDELIKKREEKKKKEREEIKRKLKIAKSKQEKKKLLKQYFCEEKQKVDQCMIQGFDYSIKTQFAKYGLAGYISVVTNKKYLKGNNLATKQILKERMKEFEETQLDEEDRKLFKEMNEQKMTDGVKNLIQEIAAIKNTNAEMKKEMDEIQRQEKERIKQKEAMKERFYMLGDHIFNEYDFDLLDQKAKERIKPYIKLITQKMAKKNIGYRI
jgi:hypothetical protein